MIVDLLVSCVRATRRVEVDGWARTPVFIVGKIAVHKHCKKSNRTRLTTFAQEFTE